MRFIRTLLPLATLMPATYAAAAAASSNFILKGLAPGITLQQFKARVPALECKQWLNGVRQQRCSASSLPSDLETLGGKTVLGMNVMADGADVVHQVTFVMMCPTTTAELLPSLTAKFGKPNAGNSIGWRSTKGELILIPANGKNEVCLFVTDSDAAIQAEDAEMANPRPPLISKDF